MTDGTNSGVRSHCCTGASVVPGSLGLYSSTSSLETLLFRLSRSEVANRSPLLPMVRPSSSGWLTDGSVPPKVIALPLLHELSVAGRYLPVVGSFTSFQRWLLFWAPHST